MQIEIEVPNNLSEITLSQYTRYLNLIETNKDIEHIDKFMSLKMLEIFCNVPYNSAMQFKITDVNRVVDHLVELLNQKPDLVHTFSIGDTEFGFIPKLDDMTFGEYIDLDQFLGSWDNMYKAMAVLYRPINKRVGKFYNIKEYTGDSYWEAMQLTPLDAVLSSTLFFLSFRDRLIETYDELFNGESSGSNLAKGFGRKWGWYQSVYALAQGDVRRYEDISRMKMHTCLLALSFEKEKQEIENKNIQNQFKK